jgi:ribonucleotide reductase alpha subunit
MPGIGSSAAVYGIVSMIVSPISFGVEPIWECFIDGESTGTPTTIYTNQNRQKLCQFDELDSSEAHTLAIHATSNQQLFWIDYIESTPSSTANFTGAFVSIQHDDHFLGYDDTWQSSSSGAKSISVVGATVKASFTGAYFSFDTLNIVLTVH